MDSRGSCLGVSLFDQAELLSAMVTTSAMVTNTRGRALDPPRSSAPATTTLLVTPWRLTYS